MQITKEQLDQAAEQESQKNFESQVEYFQQRAVVLRAYVNSLEALLTENDIPFRTETEDEPKAKPKPRAKAKSKTQNGG